MFPLILGISLGVFLLMVILFLIMELVETYPVWKQFKGFYSTHRAGFPSRENRNSQKWKTLLLSLAGIGAIALICYLLSQQPTEEKRSQVKAETATINVPVKNLSAPSADSAILFRLKTKWEDGKLYGNSTVAFATEAVPRFNNCRFYLLDKDGF